LIDYVFRLRNNPTIDDHSAPINSVKPEIGFAGGGGAIGRVGAVIEASAVGMALTTASVTGVAIDEAGIVCLVALICFSSDLANCEIN
jgi:hypothetical protein